MSDLQPPELVALDISPRVINVSQTSLEAVCVMRLRDDLSGVVFDYPQGTFLRAYLWLKSPSAVQEALARDFIVLSGDSMDGDLPPGTSPLSKLDLGPFEVHSMV